MQTKESSTTLTVDDIQVRKDRLAARLAEINLRGEREMQSVLKMIERAKAMFKSKQI